MRGGYQIQGTWLIEDPEQQRRFVRRIRQLWPEGKTCPFTDPDRGDIAGPRPASPLRAALDGASSSKGPAGAPQPAEARGARPEPHERPQPPASELGGFGGASASREREPDLSRSARTDPSRRPSGQPVESPDPQAPKLPEAAVQVAPGDPPIVMVGFRSLRAFLEGVRVVEGLIEVRFRSSPAPPLHRVLALYLRLPQGVVIQLRATATPLGLGTALVGTPGERADLVLLRWTLRSADR